jgi:hypothetical protein
MKFVFHQLQREGHLLVVETGLDGDLFIGRQARQQVTDLRAAIDHQARGGITHIELRVVLHGLDEVQFILGEEGVTLHDVARRVEDRSAGNIPTTTNSAIY